MANLRFHVQGARDADPRSDVWALGVMLFELIAGRMPFEEHDAPALFIAIATKDAPSLVEVRAEVPPEFSRVVARCLRRRPDERYPSAAELARDLRHAAEGTELEPTGKRSVPPAAVAAATAAAAHDLTVPAVGPLDGDEVATEPGPGSPASPEEAQRALPAAPSLLPPPPRSPAAAELAPHPPRPPHAAPESLSGIGIAPGRPSGPMSVARTASHPAARDAPQERPRADTAGLIGGAVVALVVILGVGLLMQLAHRPEGWPVARFVLQPGQTMEVALHVILAILVVAIGATYSWRGVRHWRGDLSGGHATAIVNALVAAGAFFSAIELMSATT